MDPLERQRSSQVPESTTPDIRACTSRPADASRARASVRTSPAPGAVDLPSLVPITYAVMFRNIASDGFVHSVPRSPGDVSRESKPGRVVAAPSLAASTPGIDEDTAHLSALRARAETA
jgi:glucoamylase